MHETMDDKGKIRLLLVEDETDLADIISDTLSEKGFEVRCVGNGADGLRAVTDFRPEIVVTDIMMPVMDGYTFVGCSGTVLVRPFRCVGCRPWL